MKALYLSYFLQESTPAYGGVEGSVVFKKCRQINQGDTSNNLELNFPGHIGTHIDFPYHFSDDGKKCQDYPADFWLFSKVGYISCDVAELEQRLNNLPRDIELLLFRSGFGEKRGSQEYWASQPVIPARYAGIFRNQFPQLRVFGFDMISLTSKIDRREGKAAHISFLIEHEILIIEDMNLTQLEEAPDKVVVQPLQVLNADGVPCSIIAYK